MKRLLTTLILIVTLSYTALWACEFSYTITDTQNKSVNVIPSQPAMLKMGETYTFSISFYEDHRNCVVSPSDTLFLLDGGRWRVARQAQGLVLDEAIVWEENSSRLNTGVGTFTALRPGSYTLEVIRECSRGGYTAELRFIVS
ncbi:MAG: hypothetical protein EOM15_17845 [Spirochaetia bacterium]|nr:hypothetical protein [Spirochaetia bacterium]